MKYVIWGAGVRGQCLAYHLKNDLVAFIDSDESKQGKKCKGVDIISFKDYLSSYDDAIIVISTHEEEISKFLLKENIYSYYFRSENPEDFLSSNPRDVLKEYIQKNIVDDIQYAIYGNTLYANLLYSWLIKCNLKYKPYLIVEDVNDTVYHLRKEYGECLLCKRDIADKHIDVILVKLDCEHFFSNERHKGSESHLDSSRKQKVHQPTSDGGL